MMESKFSTPYKYVWLELKCSNVLNFCCATCRQEVETSSRSDDRWISPEIPRLINSEIYRLRSLYPAGWFEIFPTLRKDSGRDIVWAVLCSLFELSQTRNPSPICLFGRKFLLSENDELWISCDCLFYGLTCVFFWSGSQSKWTLEDKLSRI